MLRWIFQCYFLTSLLFGGVIEDEARVETISNFKTCRDTLKEILQEKVQSADPSALERAKSALDEVALSLSFFESNLRDFEMVLWDVYPKFARAYSLLQGLSPELNEPFVQYGFRQGTIAADLTANFLNAFQRAKAIPFLVEDADPNYIASGFGRDLDIEELLNHCNTYVMLDELQLETLKPILSALKDPITECIGMPWRVVNVRAWKTAPESQKVGPNSWHKDGLSPAVLKIMFYPLGANAEKGGIAFQLPQGEEYVVEERAPTWVFFRNSELNHQGIPPQIGERIAVEITLVPSLSYDLTPICAGHNARQPVVPWTKPYTSTHRRYQKGEVAGVNVGGGPNWGCSGWINLEEVISPCNPHPFRLFPTCRFPLQNESVKSVYTSHAMEHLSIPTAYRVLSEAYRVLEEGGNLIIKIPDYDKALDCWRRQDYSFFGPGWNIESVTPLWAAKGVYDCLDYRAAMIFCSFFNDAYGNPFGATSGSSSRAAPNDPEPPYFGPPIVTIPFLRELIKDKSPSQIAQELRKCIGAKENHFRYCHQSAWSREELKAVLNDFGFEVVSFDHELIIKTFREINGIHDMSGISIFCWAKKKAPSSN